MPFIFWMIWIIYTTLWLIMASYLRQVWHFIIITRFNFGEIYIGLSDLISVSILWLHMIFLRNEVRLHDLISLILIWLCNNMFRIFEFISTEFLGFLRLTLERFVLMIISIFLLASHIEIEIILITVAGFLVKLLQNAVLIWYQSLLQIWLGIWLWQYRGQRGFGLSEICLHILDWFRRCWQWLTENSWVGFLDQWFSYDFCEHIMIWREDIAKITDAILFRHCWYFKRY